MENKNKVIAKRSEEIENLGETFWFGENHTVTVKKDEERYQVIYNIDLADEDFKFNLVSTNVVEALEEVEQLTRKLRQKLEAGRVEYNFEIHYLLHSLMLDWIVAFEPDEEEMDEVDNWLDLFVEYAFLENHRNIEEVVEIVRALNLLKELRKEKRREEIKNFKEFVWELGIVQRSKKIEETILKEYKKSIEKIIGEERDENKQD